MVKFNRASVIQYIEDGLGVTDGEITLTITGNLVQGASFEGEDTISVISRGKARVRTLLPLELVHKLNMFQGA